MADVETPVASHCKLLRDAIFVLFVTTGQHPVLNRSELQQYEKQASDEIMYLNNRISVLKKDLETRRAPHTCSQK